MKKLTLIAGVATGYVLGSRAGRERYEQIKAGAARLARNPKVQSAAGKAQAVVTDAGSSTGSSTGSSAAEGAHRKAPIQSAP